MSGCKAMAASATPRPTPAEPLTPGAVTRALVAWQIRESSEHRPTLPLAVAYSGGADSTALLHAAYTLWPGQVHAIHVNHGLQAAADDFERHCRAACAALGVPLTVQRVQAQAAPGESPEDAARRARYHALAEAARACAVSQVLLAQHADDQVETVLLALSRGAGLAGLAGMPARIERHGVVFGRPLLSLSGPALRAELQAKGLAFIDDPTNADDRFTRNRIRHHLLPALDRVFASWRAPVARSAAHAAQAAALLDEYAALDLQQVGTPPRIEALQKLSAARQGNVLRWWLRQAHGVRPSTVQLQELLAQLADCTTRGHRIDIRVGTGWVLRDGPLLLYEPAGPQAKPHL